MVVEQTAIDWTEDTHVKRRGPDTSLVAAERMAREGTAARQSRYVLDLFLHCGTPATSREIADTYRVDYHMVARRVADLHRPEICLLAPVLGDDGKQVRRDGCGVWRVT